MRRWPNRRVALLCNYDLLAVWFREGRRGGSRASGRGEALHAVIHSGSSLEGLHVHLWLWVVDLRGGLGEEFEAHGLNCSRL
jgi:hypothetical protein